jgi:hypothetical protein
MTNRTDNPRPDDRDPRAGQTPEKPGLQEPPTTQQRGDGPAPGQAGPERNIGRSSNK